MFSVNMRIITFVNVLAHARANNDVASRELSVRKSNKWIGKFKQHLRDIEAEDICGNAEYW